MKNKKVGKVNMDKWRRSYNGKVFAKKVIHNQDYMGNKERYIIYFKYKETPTQDVIYLSEALVGGSEGSGMAFSISNLQNKPTYLFTSDDRFKSDDEEEFDNFLKSGSKGLEEMLKFFLGGQNPDIAIKKWFDTGVTDKSKLRIEKAKYLDIFAKGGYLEVSEVELPKVNNYLNKSKSFKGKFKVKGSNFYFFDKKDMEDAYYELRLEDITNLEMKEGDYAKGGEVKEIKLEIEKLKKENPEGFKEEIALLEKILKLKKEKPEVIKEEIEFQQQRLDYIMGFTNRTPKDFKLGELVYDTRNKTYGTIIGIYDNSSWEVRLDSDGMQPTEYLRKLGEDGDKGTKKQLFEGVSSIERLRSAYPENNYPKLINNPFYAKGGEIDVKIKDWYTKTYPTDDLGEEMNDTNTFEDLEDALNKGDNVYNTMGVGDSLIRERLFEHLAKVKGVEYNFIYKKWLGNLDYPGEIKSKYAKGGTTDDVIMIEIGGDKKYPYYIKKIDTTHMSMANNKDGVDLVVPSNILQHKGESYYDDVRSWLRGGTSPNGKSYDSDYYAKGGSIGSGAYVLSLFEDAHDKVREDGFDDMDDYTEDLNERGLGYAEYDEGKYGAAEGFYTHDNDIVEELASDGIAFKTYSGNYAKGGEIKDGGRYLDIVSDKNKLIITPTKEGLEEIKELREARHGDRVIMSELFEDIRNNSELGEMGFGLTSAPGITDGYYYDDDGEFTDKGHTDSRLYYFDNYMLRSEIDDLVNRGEVVLDKVNFAKGGEVKKKGNEMLIGGLAGILLGIFLNK